MGMEKYEEFVKRSKSTLTYTPGWSGDNLTGAWRALRPHKDAEICNDCGLCWLYCPEGCISFGAHEIDYAYCKGCGICAAECKRGAMVMKRETE
ncbi:MAG: 4Fe-4S binding protein [Planctomycetota bacterium]|jgi:2-oxoacid:acceptor oxidoreductase delta subunit (pyruvate/2-ketoisovalerate family)